MYLLQDVFQSAQPVADQISVAIADTKKLTDEAPGQRAVLCDITCARFRGDACQ